MKMRGTFLFVSLVVLTATLSAQKDGGGVNDGLKHLPGENKVSTTVAPPSLTEEAKQTLLSDLKSVILAQKTIDAKVARFNAEYNKQVAGLPKGSSINVNAESDLVEIVLPAPEKVADKDKK